MCVRHVYVCEVCVYLQVYLHRDTNVHIHKYRHRHRHRHMCEYTDPLICTYVYIYNDKHTDFDYWVD